MTFFFVMTAWAFLESLQDSSPAPRLVSPMVLFSVLREMMEIFLLITLSAGILASANASYPGAQDFLIASGAICFYLYGLAFKRRESFIWMAYAVVFCLVREASFPRIAFRGFEIAVGVAGLRFVFKGIQKRHLFFPLPAFAVGLPGYFVTASMISLILSSLFVR